MDALRAELGAEMQQQIGALRAEMLVAMASQKAELKAELNERLIEMERRLLRWMLGFWLATLPTMAGIVYALRQLGWL